MPVELLMALCLGATPPAEPTPEAVPISTPTSGPAPAQVPPGEPARPVAPPAEGAPPAEAEPPVEGEPKPEGEPPEEPETKEPEVTTKDPTLPPDASAPSSFGEPETPPALDEPSKRQGLQRHRFVYKNLTALRYNPLGAVNEFSFGWRVQLVDKNTTLFKDSYFALKAHTFLNPAFGRVGPMLELQPLALLNLQAIYNAVGYFKSFDQLQSFQSPNAQYSDSTLEKRTGRRFPGTGHYVTLSALLQAKAGRFAVRDNVKFYYAHFNLAKDQKTRRADTVYYDQTLDILHPNKGWAVTNDVDAIYLFDFGLKLGARYTLTHAFYESSMYLPGEATKNLNSPTHRVGPAVLYSPPKWHKKAAKRTKVSRKRWYNPTAILLVQWWAKHPWRTGSDVSAGVPYIVLGFSFEGDFFP